MRPMLDKFELPLVQEINTLERRVLAEHKPPGMAGSLLQNLGRRPFRVALWGVAAGPDARSMLEELDKKWRVGDPLPFTEDIVADAQLENVVIEDLHASLLRAMGISPRLSYEIEKRPFYVTRDGEGKPILDLFA